MFLDKIMVCIVSNSIHSKIICICHFRSAAHFLFNRHKTNVWKIENDIIQMILHIIKNEHKLHISIWISTEKCKQQKPVYYFVSHCDTQ